jgi:hypothetical protein
MFICLVILGRVLLSHGAGVHQWNLHYKELFDILYVCSRRAFTQPLY